MPIEKQADKRTVSPGSRLGYRITVRNRGRLAERNLRVCDRIPRRMTFVSANRKLLSVGGRRCLVIPRLASGQRVGFHLVLRVDASAPPGTESNTVEEIPGVAPPTALPPPAPLALPPPVLGVLPEKAAPIPVATEARAVVRVQARRRIRLPRFTG